MAATKWSKEVHDEHRLVRIRWDADHTSPWCVFTGSRTEVRNFARDLRKALGRPGQQPGFPKVEVREHTVTPEHMMDWAKNHR